MKQYFIVIGFFLIAFSLMWLGLYISRYKKRNSGCCGAHTHCTIEDTKSCYEEKKSILDQYTKLNYKI